MNFILWGQLDTITSYLAKDSGRGQSSPSRGGKGLAGRAYLSDTTGARCRSRIEMYTITASNDDTDEMNRTSDRSNLTSRSTRFQDGSGHTYALLNPTKHITLAMTSSTLNNWKFTMERGQEVYGGGWVPRVSIRRGTVLIVVTDERSIQCADCPDPTSLFEGHTGGETYAKHVRVFWCSAYRAREYQPPTPDGNAGRV